MNFTYSDQNGTTFEYFEYIEIFEYLSILSFFQKAVFSSLTVFSFLSMCGIVLVPEPCVSVCCDNTYDLTGIMGTVRTHRRITFVKGNRSRAFGVD